MKYVLDANVLITCFDKTYPVGVFPSLWSYLKDEFNNGDLILLDKVKTEVLRGRGDLINWINNLTAKTTVFGQDGQEISCLAEIANQTDALLKQNAYKSQAVIAEFFRAADSYLIAYCMAHGYTLVTFETSQQLVSNPYAQHKRVKIPDICFLSSINVPCIDVVEMLQQLGAKF